MDWKRRLDAIKADIEDVADSLGEGEARIDFLDSLEEAVVNLRDYPDDLDD